MDWEMEITKILAVVVGDPQAGVFHTIEYEGKLWLVPYWIEGPAPDTLSPLRIICLDGLPMQPHDTQKGPRDYSQILTQPLDKDTLEGGTAQGLVVRERPEMIRVLRSTVIPEG
jgi:hypothetical protein